jgi:hypothetical protein
METKMSIDEIKTNLEKIAYLKTTPFCYSCYKDAPTGVCKSCLSDDLMRKLENFGVEFGTDWVIEQLLNENLEIVDVSESFEQMIEDCYGEETQVGFLKLLTVEVMKDQDPIAWDIAKSEHLDGYIEDEQVVSFDNGSNYYWVSDVESYIEENLEVEEAC